MRCGTGKDATLLARQTGRGGEGGQHRAWLRNLAKRKKKAERSAMQRMAPHGEKERGGTYVLWHPGELEKKKKGKKKKGGGLQRRRRKR